MCSALYHCGKASYKLPNKIILYGCSESLSKLLQDDKVRRRNEWKKWISVSAPLPSDSGSVSPNKLGDDMLGTSFQKITIEEIDTKQSGVTGKADPNSEAVEGRFLTESIGHSQLSNGEVSENTCSSQD
jgi:la-related protein 1